MSFPPSKKKGRKSSTEATLTLTSMMDMFTIILLFLLVSYSTEGDILAVDPTKLKLPISTSREHPKIRLMIQISTDDIIVDGIKVAVVKNVMGEQDLLVKPLFEALNKNTMKVEFIARNNPSFKFTGEVLIQGDKDIPFTLLEKVMYTCGQAGYSSISLAVISRE